MMQILQTARCCRELCLTDRESVVLPLILQCLPFHDLCVTKQVCNAWRNAVEPYSPANLWFRQQLVADRWPWATVPKETSATRIEEIYRTRRLIETQFLPQLFRSLDGKLRQECKQRKYCRWVLMLPQASQVNGLFLGELSWAVRILYCMSPPAYRTIDGADVAAYNPRHSIRAGSSPGWSMAMRLKIDDDIVHQLLLDKNGYAGLQMLRQVTSTQSALFSEILQQPIDTDRWTKAFDIVEHTKLVCFLLQDKKRCLALLQDVGGIECRGIDRLAARETFSNDTSKVTSSGGGNPHPRQMPHMFNLIKLGEHVESLTWEVCCTLAPKRPQFST